MEFEDLYQDILLDHFKHPRNFHSLADGEVLVDEENPTCGDHIRLAAGVENGHITGVCFDGKGCAISLASASMMSERMRGLTPEEARRPSCAARRNWTKIGWAIWPPWPGSANFPCASNAPP
jgi:nitrogen fixation NifU-like protein